MPCYHPMQATFCLREDGKKDLTFSTALARQFALGIKPNANQLSIPCGKCMGCRLERSRQWAVRCMHESELYEDNCFVTLTFNEDNLPKNGSLDRVVIQNFIKRLRKRFSKRKIRLFYCGEYGEKLSRPHYHLCLFNLDFKDKYYWRNSNGGLPVYRSPTLESLWPFGNSEIGSLTFESAAYVARYCTKKVTGELADDHYKGRLPEFCQASLRPGIGHGWLDKFGHTDVFSHDEVICREGVRCKPPRYYDKYLEKKDAKLLNVNKLRREARGKSKAHDNTARRLKDREICQERRFQKLPRSMESVV